MTDKEEFVLDQNQIAKKVTAMPNMETRVNGYKDDKGKEWVIAETRFTQWYAKKYFDKMQFREKSK